MKKRKVSIVDILKGKFLVEEGSAKNWTFIVFLTGLAIIMITSIHEIENKVNRNAEYQKRIRELKSEYADLHKKINAMKIESEVIKRATKDSLKVSVSQPYKLTVD